MKARRNTEELNLDILADPVTNLVGALVLVVVLVIGVTSARQAGDDSPVSQRQVGGKESISELLVTIQTIDELCHQIDAEVQQAEVRLSEIGEEIESLRQTNDLPGE